MFETMVTIRPSRGLFAGILRTNEERLEDAYQESERVKENLKRIDDELDIVRSELEQLEIRI